MAGIIIWNITVLGCAILFFSIGIYALKSDKPVGFYSGVEVHENEIIDAKEYNKECSKLWKKYSLWYFISALSYHMNVYVAITFLILGCTIGIVFLVKSYNKIYDKYKVKNEDKS